MEDKDQVEVSVKFQAETIKAALKEALKEWLDEKFAQLGKWSMGAIAVAALGLLAWGLFIKGDFTFKVK
jgi:hypothetical protein